MNKWKRGAVLVLPTVGMAFATIWLFFDFSPVSIGVSFYLPLGIWRAWKEERRRQKWELNLAFKDALTCLESSIAVGYSLENSLTETVKGLEQLYGSKHAICKYFRKMTKQVELGYSMEDAFLEFGNESGVEDIRQLAEVFSIVKRTGGNLGSVMRQTAGVLQEKVELKRELHTTIAAKRMEFQIMCFVPYGILLYLKVCASSISDALYHNLPGILFMWGVLILYLCLKFWGESVIRKEVGSMEGGNA